MNDLTAPVRLVDEIAKLARDEKDALVSDSLYCSPTWLFVRTAADITRTDDALRCEKYPATIRALRELRATQVFGLLRQFEAGPEACRAAIGIVSAANKASRKSND